MTTDFAWMTAKEVLALLPIKRTAFEKLVKEGKVPPFKKFGRDRFWKAEDIKAWLETA